jgi:hypothetical protein
VGLERVGKKRNLLLGSPLFSVQVNHFFLGGLGERGSEGSSGGSSAAELR